MSDQLVLDTHIAVWLDSGDPRLSRRTVDLLDDCRAGGGTLHVTAVTAWEVAMLQARGRLKLDLPADAWLARLLSHPGVVALPLSLAAACQSYSFPYPLRDPADHLLIACAIEHGLPLVTYDRAIIEFARNFGQHFGFSVAA